MFLSKTPSTLVINSNLLDFNDFAIAPAAVSPLILYGRLSFPKPNGEIIGTCFLLRIFSIRLLSILLGIPTNPSSSASGVTLMILFFLVWIETASVPNFFKDSTISLLKSIKTDSTMFIIFSSVTLKPLINFD